MGCDKNRRNRTIRTFGFDKPKNPIFYEMAIGSNAKFAYPVPAKRKTPKALLECSLCDGIERKILGTASFSFEGIEEAEIYHHPRYVIASKKVLSLMKNNKIVGYKTCDINIQGSSKLKDEHLKELKEIEIVGRCYKIYSSDGDEIKHCSVCKKVPEHEKNKADNGIKVVEEFWDGSDIFMFDYGLLSIIVTDKIKILFEENDVTNVKFIPLTELKMR